MDKLTPEQRLGDRVAHVDKDLLARLYAAETRLYEEDQSVLAVREFSDAFDAADGLTLYAWRIGYANPRTGDGSG